MRFSIVYLDTNLRINFCDSRTLVFGPRQSPNEFNDAPPNVFISPSIQTRYGEINY